MCVDGKRTLVRRQSHGDTHRYGIKPLGNLYDDTFRSVKSCRKIGLGILNCLSDEILLQILSFSNAFDLCQLAMTSRCCYAYSTHDELWRSLVLTLFESKFLVGDTWRQSYVNSYLKDIRYKLSYFKIEGIYSDVLYHSFRCANIPIPKYWLSNANVDRLIAPSLETFRHDYELQNIPVILTNVLKDWPALTNWSEQYLADICQNQEFSASGFQLTIKDYLHYKDVLKDDQPLYIFDKDFVKKVPQLGLEYSVPKYFKEDLFSLLGENRPDYRWFILGPARSGSSFHIDPNSTSAWNAVIRGRKKWVLFPPGIVPPGVYPSNDGAEVSTPVSVIEWFMNFYNEARNSTVKPKECIVEAGEVIFVPRGWWHIVLNLEDSIAITQNYVNSINALYVLQFLKSKHDQISGCSTSLKKEIYMKFTKALEEKYPQLLNQFEEKEKKEKWSDVILDDKTFKFSF